MRDKDTRDFFERLAFEYDRTRNRLFLERARQAMNYYLGRHNRAHGSLLEIGVGTGEIFKEATVRYQRVFGFDISFNMVVIARNKIRGTANLCVADAQCVPLSDQAFDAILCMDVLEHLASPHLCLSEIGRLLSPGGVAIVTTPNPIWAPVHWLVEKLGLKVREGPHRYVFLDRVVRRAYGIKTLYNGYLVFLPFHLPLGIGVELFLNKLPLINRLGFNQLVILGKDTAHGCP